MKKYFCLAFAALALLTGCARTSAAAANDTMYQVSTLQALMLGDYHGSVSVRQMRAQGDFGLGTFDALDGEMIVVDGKVYQARGDGSVVLCADSMTTPFCSVTRFSADSTLDLPSVTSLDELKAALTAEINARNPNMMYAVRLRGLFDSVTVRSEKAQQEPYRDLNTVMQTAQVVFPAMENVRGTLVAVYFPAYMDGLNTPGLHFHFLREDAGAGGHVLALSFRGLTAELDETPAFSMALPRDEAFRQLDLTAELGSAIARVETGGATAECAAPAR